MFLYLELKNLFDLKNSIWKIIFEDSSWLIYYDELLII
jgi:hypothetical protein